jgi:hypothetical protein
MVHFHIMSSEALILFLCQLLQGLDAYTHLTAPPEIGFSDLATLSKKS